MIDIKDVDLSGLSLPEKIRLHELLELRNKREGKRNSIFDIVRRFRGRYIVLIGGSGSGKSYEIGHIIADRIVAESGHRIIGTRAFRNQVSESQFPLFVGQINEKYDDLNFNINRAVGKEKISFSENEILFAGLDDVDRLKSIYDITSAWIEEADQVTDKDFRELNRRLRGYSGDMQIYLTFNPVSRLSWIKSRFFDAKDGRTICLRGEQPFEDFPYWKDVSYPDSVLAKKVKTYHERAKKDIYEYKYNTLIIHSTYLDNQFIDDQYMIEMEKMKDEDIDEYNVYALGMWGVAGGTFFPKDKINERLIQSPQPLKRGYFEYDYDGLSIKKIRWVDDKDGYIRIFEEPKKGYPYVGGGDTSGEGSDWNTGYFTDNTTHKDVAVLKVNFDEDLYARQMYCLGKYYNDALLAIEVNFSTHPQKELERLGYHKFYIREQEPDSFTGKLVPRYGFKTTTATRPLMLGMLRQLVRERIEVIRSIELLDEMSTFVKNEKGKPEAMNGAHDDLVIARAINCYASSQQSRDVDYTKLELPSGLPDDIRDDIENDEEAFRHFMKEFMGGEPKDEDSGQV